MLGLTVINYLTGIVIILQTELYHFVMCYPFLHLNFCNYRAQGRWMSFPSPHCSWFQLLTQTSFVVTLCWCPWTADWSAPGVVWRISGDSRNGRCWMRVWDCLYFFTLSFLYFRFRTVEFVVASFVQFGRKRLPYWRAEGEWAVVLCDRLLCLYCVVWLWNNRVCPRVILSATVFQLINLRGCHVK